MLECDPNLLTIATGILKKDPVVSDAIVEDDTPDNNPSPPYGWQKKKIQKNKIQKKKNPWRKEKDQQKEEDK